MNPPGPATTQQPARVVAWLQRSDWLLPAIVLALSLAGTQQLWRHQQAEERQVLEDDFRFRVRETTALIHARMLDYQQVLRGTQALFSTGDPISRAQFRNYVDTLSLGKNFPGILGVSFVKLIPAAQKSAHESSMRDSGFPHYAIKPGGARAFYAPVVYIEPFAGSNLHAFGHDLYSDPMRRRAMDRARDTNQPSITGKLVLEQEEGEHPQPGFMMYLPLYRYHAESITQRRASLVGWISAPLRMPELIRGIYGEHAADLDIEIYDGTAMTREALLNDSDQNFGSRDQVAEYEAIRRMDIAGHVWTAAFRSRAAFEARLDRQTSRLVAGGGTLASFLLAWLTRLLVTGRTRALKAAQRMNKELLSSEARLRQLTSTLGEGVYMLDQRGLVTFVNPELLRLLGFAGDELIGKDAHALFHCGNGEGHTSSICEIEMALRFGQSYRSEQKFFRRKDGSVLPVAVIASPILNGQQVLGSVVAFHDITERKRAEAALAEQNYKTRMLLQMASDGIHIIDEQGNLLQANDTFCRMLGYGLQELLGMNVRQWDDQYTEPELKSKVEAIMHAEGAELFETRHRRKDGSVYDVEINAAAVEISGRRLIYASARDITERKRVEQALRESEERWSFALEGAGDGVFDWNIETGEILWSRRCREIQGWDADEPIDYTLWSSLLHPEDQMPAVACLQAYLEGKTPAYVNEYRSRCKDGTWKWIMSRGKIVGRDMQGRPLRMIGTHTDITGRREREEALQLAATVFDIVDEAVTVTGPDNRIITVNPAFTRITGYTLEEVGGRNPRLLASGVHSREYYQELWDTLLTTGNWSGEICNRRKGGELYIEWLSIKMVRNSLGRHTHYVAVFSDISARKAAEARIHHLAHYDVLTDLPNRMLMNDRIQQALALARRETLHLALMFIDLDRFKPINDTLGHNIGDLLLQDVAARLLDCVRESDTVARIGGDEFLVLLPSVERGEDAVVVADMILDALNLPFDIAGHALRISSSIGISIYPEHGHDERALIKSADVAMYHAKEQGGNNARIFDPGLMKPPRNRQST